LIFRRYVQIKRLDYEHHCASWLELHVYIWILRKSLLSSKNCCWTFMTSQLLIWTETRVVNSQILFGGGVFYIRLPPGHKEFMPYRLNIIYQLSVKIWTSLACSPMSCQQTYISSITAEHQMIYNYTWTFWYWLVFKLKQGTIFLYYKL
jgi:hypothetical protein